MVKLGKYKVIKSCEPTYKELKLYEVFPAPLQLIIRCEPTYKELKPTTKSDPVENSVVASLPIRNWNFPLEKDSLLWLRSCEPTYKELKHFEDIVVEVFPEGCEPTYKELKLLIAIEKYHPLYIVASLPIRNWNWWRGIEKFSGEMGCEPTYKELKPWQK